MASDPFVKPVVRVGTSGAGIASPMQRALIFDTDSGFTVTSVDGEVVQGADGASITGYYLVTWGGTIDTSTAGLSFELGAPTGGPPTLSQGFALTSGGTSAVTYYITDAPGGGVALYMRVSSAFIFSTPNDTTISASDDGIYLDAKSGGEVRIRVNTTTAVLHLTGTSIEIAFGDTSVSLDGTNATITTTVGQMKLDDKGVLSLATADSAPVGTPVGKCYLWLDPGDGKLKARPPSGTTTDLAP